MKKFFVLASRDWLGAGGWLRILAMVMAVVQLSGCVALVVGGAAGAGGAAWVMGKLEDTVNKPVSRVYDASLKALKQMELPVFENQKDVMSAKITSMFADDKKVWISIESVTADTSRITIRVGLTGDEAKSRRILEAVHKNL
jgi:hypothetical protein